MTSRVGVIGIEWSLKISLSDNISQLNYTLEIDCPMNILAQFLLDNIYKTHLQ